MRELSREEFYEVLRNFSLEPRTEPYGNGHINDTFLIDATPKYILQRINTDIFKDPVALMQNIASVTEYIKANAKKRGMNPMRSTLSVFRTLDNRSVFQAANGDYYRVYQFIEDCDSIEKASDLKYYYNAAVTIGTFYSLLDGFDAALLTETIPDFHNTKKRFADLKRAIQADKASRAASAQAEIQFALDRESMTDVVLRAIEDGSVPLRVTHNDTKMNNILFDAKTGEGVCLIDLDTVMPGSFLYDYGDFLRFAANHGEEDDRDLSRVYFDLDIFEAFTKGCFASVGAMLTPAEIRLMPFAAALLTYECGIRFLEDYLKGDTYFKTHRENHNLERARAQFKLVSDIEGKLDRMAEIVERNAK